MIVPVTDHLRLTHHLPYNITPAYIERFESGDLQSCPNLQLTIQPSISCYTTFFFVSLSHLVATMPAAITPPLSFVPLRDTKLFSPLQLGRLSLSHRIVQAPCTRMRGQEISRGVYVPMDRHVTYYEQRASAGGLQLTEATDICLNASAYPGVPGVFTDTQLAGWRRVTDAVHAKGGFIVVQLWHTGRASGPGMRGGLQPISSTAKPMSGTSLDGADCAANPPRPMTVGEIHELTAEWAAAAKRAVDVAGFDGVEIHGQTDSSIPPIVYFHIVC